jgi:hypothetical protein
MNSVAVLERQSDQSRAQAAGEELGQLDTVVSRSGSFVFGSDERRFYGQIAYILCAAQWGLALEAESTVTNSATKL